MNDEWYEVAVSYKDNHGTETISTFDKLKDAKEYAKNPNDFSESFMELWEEVDFIFIDKWYTEDDYENVMLSDKPAIRYDKPAVIINKENK